jgi:hypothetical protein
MPNCFIFSIEIHSPVTFYFFISSLSGYDFRYFLYSLPTILSISYLFYAYLAISGASPPLSIYKGNLNKNVDGGKGNLKMEMKLI